MQSDLSYATVETTIPYVNVHGVGDVKVILKKQKPF